MEIILAATIFTILAGIIGFLAFAMSRSNSNSEDTGSTSSTSQKKMMGNKNNASEMSQTARNTSGVCDGDISNADNSKLKSELSDMLLSTDEIESLSPLEDCNDAFQMKELVRHLRDNQLKDMTSEERNEEERIQQQQLSDIFSLLQTSQERFGIDSMEDMEEQMKLYTSGE